MNGLFIGLTTIDVIHYVDRAPAANEKIAAVSTMVCSGGPAANAAITFAKLGGRAELITRIGDNPLAAIIRSELQQYGVVLHDICADEHEPPVVASAIVNLSDGDRTVVGVKPHRADQQCPAGDLPQPSAAPDVILIDSYYNRVARGYLQQAGGVPVVLDGGSWKSSLPEVLGYVDYAVCSERFRAPQCGTAEETARSLHDAGIGTVCFTRGAQPIVVFAAGPQGVTRSEVPVERVEEVRDTLAAGDIFHGAFCYYLAESAEDLSRCLTRAAKIAARSIQALGPRGW